MVSIKYGVDALDKVCVIGDLDDYIPINPYLTKIVLHHNGVEIIRFLEINLHPLLARSVGNPTTIK